MVVRFHFQSAINLPERTRLKSFLEKLCRKEGRKIGELQFIFVSDNELLEINRQFLQHDYFTDVITFDLGSGEPGLINAEIYISTDRVRDNAKSFNQSLKRELHRVIFHAVLHLCGYSDKKKGEKEIMRGKEDQYLKLYLK